MGAMVQWLSLLHTNTAQKIKLFIKDFFSKYDQMIWSHLLKKSLMENLIFCAVKAWTQFLRKFKSYSRRVVDLQW